MNIEVTIKGTNAILLHKYTTATVSDPKSRITTKDSANYADEWIKGTYLNNEDQVVMPWTNLAACLFDGAKGMKKGKTALTRVVYTSLAIAEPESLLLYNGKPITIEDIRKNNWLHICGAVISGRRIDRVRTMIPSGWEITFPILVKEEGTLTLGDIKSILDNAGLRAGLGDWRPSSPKKPGPYGVFTVVSFKEMK